MHLVRIRNTFKEQKTTKQKAKKKTLEHLPQNIKKLSFI